ncbi:MAG: TldD/PmbA family protein [Acidobacteria bacterium]|nr:TldD/PmbA family protein [Acidobacteriota bacterium]
MHESPLLSRTRCEEVFALAQDCARSLGASDIEVQLGGGASALTRFANNTIHQNVAERSGYLSVRALLDRRTARASTNRLDADAIRDAVKHAIRITRLQAPDPDLPPLARPEPWTPVSRACSSTAETTPEQRARAVAAAIREVEGEGQIAAGIYSTGESVFAVLNSAGVFAYHAETMAVFSITAMAPDSSGWAKASACDASELDPVRLARSAVRKARESRAPIAIEPGRYTVVLEPAAVLDLVGQMFPDFSGTALRDERSFLNDRLGKPVFGSNIHIFDDVCDPRQAGAPFDAEGVPRRRLVLVERGVPKQIAYSRQAARLAGAAPTGHGFAVPNEAGEAPVNVVIAGGEAPLEELIRTTGRGILVTRLWYIREVDAYEKIMTGMTRDGTFLIEDGRITRGLRNLRFNQSLVELLGNVEAMSPAGRAAGEEAPDMVAPAMKVRDFHFTEVTRF